MLDDTEPVFLPSRSESDRAQSQYRCCSKDVAQKQAEKEQREQVARWQAELVQKMKALLVCPDCDGPVKTEGAVCSRCMTKRKRAAREAQTIEGRLKAHRAAEAEEAKQPPRCNRCKEVLTGKAWQTCGTGELLCSACVGVKPNLDRPVVLQQEAAFGVVTYQVMNSAGYRENSPAIENGVRALEDTRDLEE